MRAHGNLRIEQYVDPAFQENTYLVWNDSGPDAWIIDPGLPPQAWNITRGLAKHGLSPQAMLLTHCHGDHIAGVAPLRERFPSLQLWAPRDESHMLGDAAANLSNAFGMDITTPPADRLLAGGNAIALGGQDCRVLDVAGHSPGGLAYYLPAPGVVFTGDALFPGSIGRTDFPGSSYERLMQNIVNHLMSLPPETVVYSGHGPPTTIGDERESNPYVREWLR